MSEKHVSKYSEFECSLSDPYENKHFVKSPYKLNCGHHVCEKCFSNNYGDEIKCKECGKGTRFNNVIKDERMNYKIDEKVNDLIVVIENRFKETLSSIKNQFEKFDETLEARINYIKEQLEVKIESIKIDLDKINLDYQNHLERIKNELKKEKELKQEVHKNEILKAESNYKEIKLCDRNKEWLYKHQENLKETNELLKKLDHYKFELSFDESSNPVPQTLIGILKYNKKMYNDLNGSILRTRLKRSESYEKIPLKKQPYDICLLPNNNIAVAFYHFGLTIYNNYFEEINSTGYSYEKGASIFSLSTNFHDKIYFVNLNSHEVVALNFDLNIVHCIGNYGSDNDKIAFPSCVRYYKSKVYVADYRNSKIKIFNEDLTYYDSSRKLNFKPFQFCIGNDIMAIVPNINQEKKLYFVNCDNDDFKIIKEYDNIIAKITFVNDNFYAYLHEEKKMLCYNGKGDFIEKIELKILQTDFKEYPSNETVKEPHNGTIINIDESFLFNISDYCCLIKF